MSTACIATYGPTTWAEVYLDSTNCVKVDSATGRVYGTDDTFYGSLARRLETYDATQSATLEIIALPQNNTSGSQFIGTGVQVKGSGGTRSGYFSLIFKDGSTVITSLVKFDVGAFSTIGSSSVLAWVVNDRIGTSISGSTVTTTRNGATVLSYTDGSPLSGGTPGLIAAGGSGTVASGDNFIATGVPGAPSSVFSRGSSIPIHWTSDGVTGNVSLRYSLQGASGYFYPIADVAACANNVDCSYNWTATVPASSTVVVCVEQDAADCAGSIKSISGEFRIRGKYLR